MASVYHEVNKVSEDLAGRPVFAFNTSPWQPKGTTERAKGIPSDLLSLSEKILNVLQMLLLR